MPGLLSRPRETREIGAGGRGVIRYCNNVTRRSFLLQHHENRKPRLRVISPTRVSRVSVAARRGARSWRINFHRRKFSSTNLLPC